MIKKTLLILSIVVLLLISIFFVQQIIKKSTPDQENIIKQQESRINPILNNKIYFIDCIHNVVCYQKSRVTLSCTYTPQIPECRK